jgi:DivIVA domain-containing protein
MEATQGDASPRRVTPADVHNIAFTRPPIGKRGYHEQEVDDFLDIVEQELSRLIEDNEQLKANNGADPAAIAAATEKAVTEERSRLKSELEALSQRYSELEQSHSELQRQHYELQQAQGDSGQVSQALQDQLRAAQERAAQAEHQAREAHEQLAAAQANQGGGSMSSPEQHQQAVKVLALAQATADQHLAEAQAEAERLRSEAQAMASQLHQESTAQAERRVAEAQARADQLNQESSSRATKLVQDAEQRAGAMNEAMESRRGALQKHVDELRTFEREYRTRLKSYLESQLRDLERGGQNESDRDAEGQTARA